MNGMVDIFVWRCHTLLIRGLRPLPLWGLRKWMNKTTIVPQGCNFINSRCSEAQSTDKTPPQPRILSGMQPDSPFAGNVQFERQIPHYAGSVRNDGQLVFRRVKREYICGFAANVFPFHPLFKRTSSFRRSEATEESVAIRYASIGERCPSLAKPSSFALRQFEQARLLSVWRRFRRSEATEEPIPNSCHSCHSWQSKIQYIKSTHYQQHTNF